MSDFDDTLEIGSAKSRASVNLDLDTVVHSNPLGCHDRVNVQAVNIGCVQNTVVNDQTQSHHDFGGDMHPSSSLRRPYLWMRRSCSLMQALVNVFWEAVTSLHARTWRAQCQGPHGVETWESVTSTFDVAGDEGSGPFWMMAGVGPKWTEISFSLLQVSVCGTWILLAASCDFDSFQALWWNGVAGCASLVMVVYRGRLASISYLGRRTVFANGGKRACSGTLQMGTGDGTMMAECRNRQAG